MRKLCSLLLTLCLLALLCVPALAEEECDHHFYEGICEYCGAPCPHAQTFTNTWLDENGTILSTSEDGHVLRGTLHEDVHCAECFEVLAENLTPDSSMLERHFFNDGVCSICGYKIACTHPRTVSFFEDKKLINSNAAGHTVEAIKITVCEVCSTILSETRGTFLEEHNNWGDGECAFCGYVITCEHEHTKMEQAFEYGAMLLVSYDEDGHTLWGESINIFVCLDCGAEMPDYGGGSRLWYLPHDFLNGRCTICNYKQGNPIPTTNPAPTATPTPTVKPTAEPTTAPTDEPTDEPTPAPTAVPTEKPTAKPGKADVPKTGERSFAPAMAALMLCAAGALLLAKRK